MDNIMAGILIGLLIAVATTIYIAASGESDE